MKRPAYLTISELAKDLGISRVAVYKRIKLKKIKAIRIGNRYLIPASAAPKQPRLTSARKRTIEKAVHRTVEQYGELLRQLGNE